jgi:hypothetical protein
MPRPEHYHQPALSLDQTQRSQASAEHQEPTPAGTNHHGDEPIMPSIAADPEGMPHGFASHRIPNDFWHEFHLEWEFRERSGMMPVSPAEFADMRDWSDGLIEPEDVAWTSSPDPLPYERKKTE